MNKVSTFKTAIPWQPRQPLPNLPAGRNTESTCLAQSQRQCLCRQWCPHTPVGCVVGLEVSERQDSKDSLPCWAGWEYQLVQDSQSIVLINQQLALDDQEPAREEE